MNARLRTLLPAAALLALVILPRVGLSVPGLFEGSLDSAGTLNLLSLCFVFGALALSYDIVFGYTGLLSFGHALYFASGVYVTAIALARFHWTLPQALGLTAVVGLVLPLVLGAVALRTRDIPFAMVTLAFAEAGSILILKNPLGLTGGEEGLALGAGILPASLAGVANTRNVYWIALALLAVACAVGWWAVNSRAGRVWQAIRENERRVAVLGLNPYAYKLGAFVLAGFLASAAGAVYLLVQGGANPEVTTANFTLTLLVMVVLGGVGTLWGAVLGGIAYEYLDFRLVALSNAPVLQQLPSVVRVPLSEPLFLLGALFVVLVLFVPGGFAGALRALVRRPRFYNA
ncbi:MAG: branched-chain amino acid ABC transporter permease [Candidatus Eremiobacteraeota bacterium]|nr:branched-chain amino acid ABC transporter permease [Candidatus Eremiobacteraeota bacterium]